jgi:MFS family permease
VASAKTSRRRLPDLASALLPLRDPDFRKLWLAQMGSAIGDGVLFLALPFAALAAGGSVTDVGWVLGALAVSRLGFVLIGGVWADRSPRRRVMVSADALRAASQLALASLLINGSAQIVHLVIGAVILGLGQAFFGPAASGLLRQTVTKSALRQGAALMGFSENATYVIGPAVGGLIVAAVGPGWAIGLDALSYVFSASLLLGVRVHADIRPSVGRPGFAADLQAGWREVKRRPWMVVGLTAFCVINLCIATVAVLGPIVATASLGGAQGWGSILATGGIGALCGTGLALVWRPHRPVLTIFVAYVFLSLQMLALVGPFPGFVVAAATFIRQGLSSAGIAWWRGVLQHHIPGDALSRVTAYDLLARHVIQPFGYAVTGPLAMLLGVGGTLGWAAGVTVVAAALAAMSPAIRRVTWISQNGD